MNKFGFTLIELLASITILGLIMLVVMPSITVLRDQNKEQTLTVYGDSLIEASKLFITREKEDITSTYNSDNYCLDISYQTLYNSNLIKPFQDQTFTCNSNNIKVRYTHTPKKDTYQYIMICTDQKNKEFKSPHYDDLIKTECDEA